jgi:tetratricopeptide (TPR) repeat protein
MRSAGSGARALGYLVVFAIALLVRVLHLRALDGTPLGEVLLGDALAYDAWARRLAAGDWIGTEVFYQAPLYPYVLGVLYAGIAPDPGIAQWAQAVGGALACVLLAIAGTRFFSQAAGLTAGVLLAVYPPAVFLVGILQKETLGLVLLTLLLAVLGGALHRPSWPRWLAAGATLGGLVLTREQAWLLLPIVGLCALAWPANVPVPGASRRKTRAAAVGAVALGIALVLGPVALRNLAVVGELRVAGGHFGTNFFMGNNPDATGRHAPLRQGHADPGLEQRDAVEIAEAALGRRLEPGEVSGYWLDRALGFITAEPGAWLRLLWRKWLLAWNAGEIVDTDAIEVHADASPALAVFFPWWHFGVLAPLAALGVWTTRRRWRAVWVLYAIVLAFALGIVVFYAQMRYRFPMVPALVLLAGAGLVDVGRALSAGRVGALAPGVAAAAVVAVVANWPLLDDYHPRATSHLNLGAALLERGDPDAALVELEQAAALAPGYAPVQVVLGDALGRVGRWDEAVGRLREAVRVEPGYAEAHARLGVVLFTTGDARAADAELRRALELDDRLAVAWNGLGNLRAAEGRFTDAKAAYERALALDPALADAHFKLGHIALEENRPEAALSYYEETVRLAPEHAPAHAALGEVLERVGRRDEAASAYRRALALDAADESAKSGLARLGS